VSLGPVPLPEGTLLAQRYEVVRTLGQGGFGITYLARDPEREVECAIKEMAPQEVSRKDSLEIDWSSVGPAASQRLRHQFVREASTLRKLRIPGIPAIRDWFHENGTAYIVSEYVAGARTLDRVLAQSGRMGETETLELVDKLCAILEPLHRNGIVHRDLKPSNILLGPDGTVLLIDFGSAREWHAGVTHHHTVQYTPGFAPIEQLSEKGKRGPATDLYGLCATAWTMLVGEPPPPSTDRVTGVALPDIRSLRSDVSPGLAVALTRGLALDYHQRPPSVEAFRDLLAEAEHGVDDGSVEDLDARMVRLQRFRFGKRACPACDGVLESVRPLPVGSCPVCREGRLRHRKLDSHLCPHCRTGRLRRTEYRGGVPRFCPVCRVGSLNSGPALPWQEKNFQCSNCPAVFAAKGSVVFVGADRVQGTWEELFEATERSSVCDVCDGCAAQFDLLPDQRWLQVHPKPVPGKPDRLYQEEWELVAAGLDPSQGNGYCDRCQADFHLETDSVTLLRASTDAFGFADDFTGVLLETEAARWAGAGKSSGNPGLTCASCRTEFDDDGDRLILVHTQHRRLRGFAGESETLGDWHRLADHLPRVGDEEELEAELQAALRLAYRAGELGVDPRDPGLAWRGEATADTGKTAPLTIGPTEITFGSFLGKERYPRSEVKTVQFTDEEVEFVFRDKSAVSFTLAPQILEARLSSGRYRIDLTAEDLALRLAD
jgi:hypothetical protein